MRSRTRVAIPRRAAAALLAALALGGCLGKPEIPERWTRIDVVGSNLAPFQMLPAGSTQPISITADVTYRSILTGFAVAELRASNTVTGGSVEVRPDAERTRMAQDIDRILQGSVSVGRATRAVTGWDHLIQRIEFTFDGRVPAAADSSGAPTGLFLLCYLGSGTEVELPDGSDSLVVTPFDSNQYELLPVGMELGVAAPGAF